MSHKHPLKHPYRSSRDLARTMGRRLLVTCVLAAAVFANVSTPSVAQEWPQRNVRFILPFGPGSAADTAARLLSEGLTTKWGKPVVVENRPGGDGLPAIYSFVGAKDDHVLLLTSTGTFLAHPYMHQKLDYSVEEDLTPIARIADTLLVVAVPESLPAANLAQFVALARQRPELNLTASPGLTELAVDSFLKTEKLDTARVSYKELGAASRDLAEGRIHFMLTSFAIVRPLVDAGKVKIIAAGTRERSPILKQTPSISESGYPILAAETSTALFGGRQMSRALKLKIAQDVMTLLNEPKVRDGITLTGQDVIPSGPDELAQLVSQQASKVESIASAIGLRKIGN